MTFLYSMNLGLAWGSVVARVGPIHIVAGQSFLPGNQRGEAFIPGAQKSGVYIPGTQQGESTSDN